MLAEIAAIANYPGREITITSSYFSVFQFCLPISVDDNSDSIVSVIILIFIASVNKIINMLYLIAG